MVSNIFSQSLRMVFLASFLGAYLTSFADEYCNVAIIGAGPTGLSAAYHLGECSLLIDQGTKVGGLCSSIEDNGFVFDQAGHIMFSKDPYVHQLYQLLLGENIHWQDREAWIYSKNTYTRYPFQSSFYGLPTNVVKECLLGLINVHLASTKNIESISEACDKCNPGVEECCADSAISENSSATHDRAYHTHSPNFEEFIYATWGDGIAKHFAIPYNKKLWGIPLSKIETSWIEGRVPLPSLEEAVLGALSPSIKPLGPNARFGYPLRGGFQALMDGFVPLLKGAVRLNSKVISIYPSRKILVLDDGTEISYKALISTMPLPKLIQAIGDEAPSEIHMAADSLEYVSVRCVNIGVMTSRPTDKHWIYYPEKRPVFHRVFVQGNTSPYVNPPGGLGFTCEISYSKYKPLEKQNEELERQCIEDCRYVNLIQSGDEIITTNTVDIPYAYVVYTHDRKEKVSLIKNWLKQHDIILSGRYSEWEYYNSDHAFLAGKKAAETINKEECTICEK